MAFSGIFYGGDKLKIKVIIFVFFKCYSVEMLNMYKKKKGYEHLPNSPYYVSAHMS